MGRVVWVLIGFAAGTVVGWAVTRQFEPDWVGAVGTSVGAIGTIATIIWAVHSFQKQTEQRIEDREHAAAERLKQEQLLAQEFRVSCLGGSGDSLIDNPPEPPTWSMNDVVVELLNGTVEPVSLVSFDLPGIEFPRDPVSDLPPTIAAGESFRGGIAVKPIRIPAEEMSGKPLKNHVPVVRYRVKGILWERVGDDPPLRCA